MTTADKIALALLVGIAVVYTWFAVRYTILSPWWRSRIGRALVVSSWGMALLVNISLLYQFFGDDYALRDVVRLTVFSLVFLGGAGKVYAFEVERHRKRHNAGDGAAL